MILCVLPCKILVPTYIHTYILEMHPLVFLEIGGEEQSKVRCALSSTSRFFNW